MKMNKLGVKLLSIWWFFVLGIIGGGLVIGVLIYSSADVSVKEFEADILSERIMDCIVENSVLNPDFDNDFDVFKKCKLNQEVFGKNSNFYFKISVLEKGIKINNGRISLEKECEIQKDVKATHFPRCSEKNEKVLYNGEEVILNILSVSDQEGKKIYIV